MHECLEPKSLVWPLGTYSRACQSTSSGASRGYDTVNAAGHRLDIRRPWPSDESWARFQTRTKIKKLCTTCHLQKSCDNALCEHDHSQIDPAMRKCLEYWAGHFKCTQNGSCRVEKCFKSHICQWPRCLSKGGARSSSCQYPLRMHGVDFKVHEWVPAENGINDYGSDGSDSLIRDLGRSFHGSANATRKSPARLMVEMTLAVVWCMT